jgi:hypothetical protein
LRVLFVTPEAREKQPRKTIVCDSRNGQRDFATGTS